MLKLVWSCIPPHAPAKARSVLELFWDVFPIPSGPPSLRHGDVRLTQEAFRNAGPSIFLHVTPDGVEAMAYRKRTGDNGEAPAL